MVFKPACSASETSKKIDKSKTSLFASQDMILFNKRITKALIRLRGCAGWSVPVLFATPEDRFLASQPISVDSLARSCHSDKHCAQLRNCNLDIRYKVIQHLKPLFILINRFITCLVGEGGVCVCGDSFYKVNSGCAFQLCHYIIRYGFQHQII